MGLQKFRADIKGDTDKNGAISFYAKWMGGPSLSLIRNCPTPFGPRTVYIRGEADTFFSIPAACTVKGKTIKGWLGCEEGNWVFHPYKEG